MYDVENIGMTKCSNAVYVNRKDLISRKGNKGVTKALDNNLANLMTS
jgi:hypothetical protein